MTQKMSSFRNWLWDFWLRCFSRKYIVKAEGKSPKTHDFRRCPSCDKFVDSLPLNRLTTKCSSCHSVILSIKSCWDDTGWYKDKKNRIFHLTKPLYDSVLSGIVGISILIVFFVAIAYRFVEVPNGFGEGLLSSFMSILFVVALSIIVLMVAIIIADHRPGTPTWRFIFYSIIIISYLSIVALCIVNRMTPRWIDIPTEQEWQLKQIQEIDKMQAGIEQFEAAQNIEHINLRPYFVAAAKVDFVILMEKHGDFAGRFLDPYHGNQFYPLVQQYLESVDEEDLMRQCTEDPWNLIYTPLSVQRYPQEISACDRILP